MTTIRPDLARVSRINSEDTKMPALLDKFLTNRSASPVFTEGAAAASSPFVVSTNGTRLYIFSPAELTQAPQLIAGPGAMPNGALDSNYRLVGTAPGGFAPNNQVVAAATPAQIANGSTIQATPDTRVSMDNIALNVYQAVAQGKNTIPAGQPLALNPNFKNFFFATPSK